MNETVEIVRLAGRGDGVTADGRFVPLATIGDRVRFGAGVPVVEPGPGHMAAACPHYPDCGGCQLHHVTDAVYRDFVVDRIVRALAGAGVASAGIAPVALSPPASRRRAALRAVRRGGRLTLGFHAEATHRIVDLSYCAVLTAPLLALVAPLRMLLGSAIAEGQGAGISLTECDTGIDLLLANVAATRLDDIERLSEFAAKHDLARLSIEGPDGLKTLVEARLPILSMGDVPVALPPAPFLQATREGEAALVAAVVEAAAGAARIADLFCGIGTFALPLSRTAQVLAVDAAGPAIAALGVAARSAGRRVTTAHRDLFRRPLTVVELAGFDAVVFDPPRAGAAAQAAALAASAVPVVVAVSCNPATFARDARTLVDGGYRLEKLWPVAQFRWSTHVELVARFTR